MVLVNLLVEYLLSITRQYKGRQCMFDTRSRPPSIQILSQVTTLPQLTVVRASPVRVKGPVSIILGRIRYLLGGVTFTSRDAIVAPHWLVKAVSSTKSKPSRFTLVLITQARDCTRSAVSPCVWCNLDGTTRPSSPFPRVCLTN